MQKGVPSTSESSIGNKCFMGHKQDFGLTAEFCAVWAELVVEEEMCTVDSEACCGPVHPDRHPGRFSKSMRETVCFGINKKVHLCPAELYLDLG